MSATSLISDSVISILRQKSEKHTATSEHWNQSQRLKLSLNMQPIQISKLEQDHIQVLGQKSLSTKTDKNNRNSKNFGCFSQHRITGISKAVL
jgi:hypothetical protein